VAAIVRCPPDTLFSKWMLPRQHLAINHSQAVLIAVDVGPAAEQFRGRVWAVD